MLTLNKTELFACIGMTGAMRLYLLNTLEALLDKTLPPTATEKVVRLGALRLSNNAKIKRGNIRGRLDVLKNFKSEQHIIYWN